MNENLFQNIRYLLANSKFSQEMLSEYLEVDQSTISNWKRGTRNISVTHIEKICDLFGCMIEDVVNGNIQSNSLNDVKFRKSNINDKKALESIASINRIVNNLNYMIKVNEKNESE